MPFDLSTRPNPLGLTEAQFALWDELLAWLDTGGDDACWFDYSLWNCGTVACIGGWFTQRLGTKENWTSYTRTAAATGLDDSMAMALFEGGMPEDCYHGHIPTAAEAAACVRRLLAEGVVDWPRAMGAA